MIHSKHFPTDEACFDKDLNETAIDAPMSQQGWHFVITEVLRGNRGDELMKGRERWRLSSQ